VVTKTKKIICGLSILVILIIILRVMVTTGVDDKRMFPLGGAFREIIAPFQEGITVAMEATDDLLAYFSDNKLLRQQNKELAHKVVVLEEEVFSLKRQKLENQRLLKLLNYKKEKENNYELEIAKVIGRDPSSWYETLTVNKGSKQGVEVEMTVVNSNGLIGRVIRVTNNTAEILLILDREGAVGGRIFESRLTPGVVEGVNNSQYLQMIHLPHDTLVEVGQTVVTSGLGGIFPEGIRIGQITEIVSEPSGLMKVAIIQPFVDFSCLEEIFIMKQVKIPENSIVGEN